MMTSECALMSILERRIRRGAGWRLSSGSRPPADPQVPPITMPTLHFVIGKRIPQQAKFRFVAEAASLLLFFDFFAVFFSKNNVPLKIAPKIGNFTESATIFAETGTVYGIHKQIKTYKNKKSSRIHNCKRNPHSVCWIQ